jgi:hypothetical protein
VAIAGVSHRLPTMKKPARGLVFCWLLHSRRMHRGCSMQSLLSATIPITVYREELL